MKGRFFLSILIPTILLIFSGCAQKPEANINIDPYIPTHAVLQKGGTIILADVIDARKDKRSVGSIVKGGKTVTVIYSDQALDEWFKNALTEALEAEGCKVVYGVGDDKKATNVKIEIDSLQIRLDRSRLTGKNLTAEAEVTLYIQRENAKITKHVGLIQSKWVPPFAGERVIKEYLHETLSDLIDEVRENIDIYRF